MTNFLNKLLLRSFYYSTLGIIAVCIIALLRNPTFPAIATIATIVLASPMVLLHVSRSRWTENDAVITDVSVRRRTNPEKERILTFDLRYTYSVASIRYSGTGKVDVEALSYEEDGIINELAKIYKIGSRIRIYYPPSAPAISATTRDIQLGVILAFLAVNLLWVLCGYLVYINVVK